jgi:hypothetical protein
MIKDLMFEAEPQVEVDSATMTVLKSNALFQRLAQMGWKEQQLAQAFTSVPDASTVTMGIALNWLLLHVPEGEVPQSLQVVAAPAPVVQNKNGRGQKGKGSAAPKVMTDEQKFAYRFAVMGFDFSDSVDAVKGAGKNNRETTTLVTLFDWESINWATPAFKNDLAALEVAAKVLEEKGYLQGFLADNFKESSDGNWTLNFNVTPFTAAEVADWDNAQVWHVASDFLVLVHLSRAITTYLVLCAGGALGELRGACIQARGAHT